MHWGRTFLPTSSGVHCVHPLSEKRGCGYNLHQSGSAGTGPSQVPDVDPWACHLSQPRLTQASGLQHVLWKQPIWLGK